MKSNKQVLGSLQAGRGVAAIAVVLHHAADYVGADPRFWLRSWYVKAFDFGAFGVEFFFVLSGIVILLAHWDSQGGTGAIWTYALRRFRRIYPIYWVVLASVAPILFLSPSFGKSVQHDPWVLLSSILLFHLYSTGTVLSVAWTLFHEIMFYIIFSLVIVHRSLGYGILGVWLSGSVLMLFKPFGTPLLQEYFSPLHLLFGLGILVVALYKIEMNGLFSFCVVPGVALLGYVCYWTFLYGLPDANVSVLAGFASALILLGLVSLEQQNFLEIPAWMSLFGDASYSIYLIHFPLLSITMRVAFRMSHYIHLAIGLWMFIQVGVVIAAGVSFHLLLEKRLMHWFRSTDRRRTLMLSTPLG